MSQATRSEANEDSESDSTTSSSRFSSSGGGGCCTESSSSSKTQATTTSDDSAPTSSTSTSDRLTNGSELQQQQQPGPSVSSPPATTTTTGPTVSATRLTNETKESNNLNNKSDEVIQRSQQEAGLKCDTTTASSASTATSRMRQATGPSLGRSGPGRPSSTVGIFQDKNRVATSATSSHLHPSTSADRTTTASFSDIRQASLTSSCSQRVSPVAISSLNISSPLDRLSECDAITRRLMSSPIRTVNLSEKPIRRSQANCDLDRSRRASLGTKSITEQVQSLFATNQFDTLGMSYEKSLEESPRRDQRHTDDAQTLSVGGGKQQLAVRSLSVCQEETLKPRCKNYNNNSSSPSNHHHHHHHQPHHHHHHSSNLNRAVSLACESSSGSTATTATATTTTTTKSKRLLTIIPLFGCDMKALEQYMRSGLILPPPIDSAINHILTHGTDAIGIFRKSGVKSRILTLKQRIENNQDARVDEINVENEFSIYDIADLVKMWFRELKPSPIMTRDLIERITVFLRTYREDGFQGKEDDTEHRNSSQISRVSMSDESTSMQSADARTGVASGDGGRLMMRQISSIISPAHRVLISRAMSFFATISSKSEINQMTSQNLAICLTPSLCATETDQASILLAQRALKYCIDNFELWREDPYCS